MSELQQTPFYPCHITFHGKMVNFAGWELPVHYGSLTAEHLSVRNDAGMFDVSHMTILDLFGTDCQKFLRWLLANDIAILKEKGKALYSCMLNEHGGVLDDLICYFFDEHHYRLIVNAATREKDVDWITQHAKNFNISIEEKPHLAMIAIQGPNAIEKANNALINIGIEAPILTRFQGAINGDRMIARTGYTGEDGYEITLEPDYAIQLWDNLIDANVQPCGLGARDTLRLEAGMALYGNDLSEEFTPIESGLKWTVNIKDTTRQFIGKETIVHQIENAAPYQMIGVVLEDRGVLREQQVITSNDNACGALTSGGYSPSLERSIGLARVQTGATENLNVVIRKRTLPLKKVPYPFIKDGKSSF